MFSEIETRRFFDLFERMVKALEAPPQHMDTPEAMEQIRKHNELQERSLALAERKQTLEEQRMMGGGVRDE